MCMSLNLKRTLVLDATGTPVDVVNWQKAMLLLFTNKAKIIYEYDDTKVNSASESWQLPSILQLMSRSRRKKQVQFSREGVFFRDNYTCGYCGGQHPSKHLTFDHIMPVCQGGMKTWENIITACFPCNAKKGGNTPEQARMPLLFKPYAPKWNPSFFIQLRKHDPIEVWQPFIGKVKVPV